MNNLKWFKELLNLLNFLILIYTSAYKLTNKGWYKFENSYWHHEKFLV